MGTAFETEMGVLPELSKAVQEMDWILPTDIQSEAIPQILGGRDVLMAAETGSGKTGAFCLPVLQVVHETLRDQKHKKHRGGNETMKELDWQMNIYDRDDAMEIDVKTNTCQSSNPTSWQGCRANKGVQIKGKYYFEATVKGSGLCRVGWSTMKSRLDLGTDKEGFGFGGTGKKSYAKQFDSYGESFGSADVIGNYIDLDAGEIRWSKNGKDLGKAFDIPKQMKETSGFFPSVCLKNGAMELNFGYVPFKFPPQGGAKAINKANKSEIAHSNYGINKAAIDTTPKPNAPLAIIIEPSRELAEQTLHQIQKFKKYLPAPIPRELLIIGGQQAREQVDALKQGVDIIVATPGRLDDLISTDQIILTNCRFFVLDEFDGLLSAGHDKLIIQLHSRIPKVTNDGTKLQMVVCSATLHSFDVKKMAERLMRYPLWIDLKGQDSVPETVHHVICPIDPHKDTSWKQLYHTDNHIFTDAIHMHDRINPTYESPEMLSEAVKILKGEYVVRAIKTHKMDKALIFCRTKLDCDNLEQYFIKMGGGPHKQKAQFSCVCLHGDRKPDERKNNLNAFKNDLVRFLICTDVAARGLDITGLPFVINVTLPDEKQNYVHRIGRVGRAERMGLAISLVATVKEKVWYHSNCANRGRNCFNTSLTTAGGCALWYNESQLLADIEEHLGVTIDHVDKDISIPVNEFDGKVVYGQKQKSAGSGYQGHVDILLPASRELARLEKITQDSYFDLFFGEQFLL